MIVDRLRSIKRSAMRIVKSFREADSVRQFKTKYLEYLTNPQPFTSMDAQYLLRAAFVESHGKSIDWALKIQRRRSPWSAAAPTSAFFPELSSKTVSDAVNQLRQDGYYVLPWRMPDQWVEAVHSATNQMPVNARADKNDIQTPKDIRPKSATYWHSQRDLASVPELRKFAADAAIYEIAARYLGCSPVVDLFAAWWTFPAGKEPDSAAAQLYHFDLDRVRWLKVFVYLTDVDESTGPHAFVRGSHNTIGSKVKHAGRYTNQEVFTMYSSDDEMVFVGPKGTVIIEDTLGFHKGIPAVKGHRFIFEYQLSVNQFGYPYEALPWKIRPVGTVQ